MSHVASPSISPPQPRWLAWVALALTIVIWASFLVSTRAAVTSSLGAVEVGLMRFGTATILLAPVWLRHGPIPKGAGLREVALIALIGGVVFILLLASGLRFAPVADSGVFAPSILPLYVAILSYFVLGERFSADRLSGFALILIGALSLGGWSALSEAEPGAWRGHLMFLSAAFCWAIYTVTFRLSRMDALQAAAMIAFWSTLALGIIAIFTGVSFAAVPPGTLALQIFLQGVLSGFLATFTYGYAITALGASRTAAFAALVPVLAALGGWVFLGEEISLVKGIGIAVVTAGVALASGAFFWRQARGQEMSAARRASHRG